MVSSVPDAAGLAFTSPTLDSCYAAAYEAILPATVVEIKQRCFPRARA
jgi:hypothetical protein